MTWIHRVEWKAMDLKQKAIEKVTDEDYKSFCLKRYWEAKNEAYDKFKKNNKSVKGRKLDLYYSARYAGPYYIVFGSSPTKAEMYVSFYESFLEKVEENLYRFFSIRPHLGKVSLSEPIPIVDIMQNLHYPDYDLTDGLNDYSCYVKLGLMPHENF